MAALLLLRVASFVVRLAVAQHPTPALWHYFAMEVSEWVHGGPGGRVGLARLCVCLCVCVWRGCACSSVKVLSLARCTSCPLMSGCLECWLGED